MISEADMDTSHLPDVHATQLRWTEQVRALPAAIRHMVARLFRREPRYYLIVNGEVMARFVSPQHELEFCEWLAGSHILTFETGANFAGGIARALNSKADAGNAGPS